MINRQMRVLTAICILSVMLAGVALPQDFEKKREGTVTILSIPGSELIYVVLSFKAGTVRDPAGKEGLSFITAKLLEDSIRRRLDEKAPSSGYYLSCRIDKELVTFFFKIHRNMFKKAYPIFIEEIVSPSTDDDDLAIARSKAENERENVIEHGESLSRTALELSLFCNHPYGRPDFGTKSSLSSIGVKDVRDFFNTFYTRENFVLGIAGFQSAEIEKKVMADLRHLTSGAPAEKPIPSLEPVEGNRALILRAESATTSVALGFPVDFTRSDDDYYSLLAANAGFGQHRYLHGLLFRELRGIRGFNYGDYSYIEKFTESDQDKMPAPRIARKSQYFYIWIRNLADDNACFAVKFALYSLEKMIEQGIPEERLMLMRDFIANNSKMWDFDPFQILGFSMDSDFYGTPYYISYIGEKMKALTKDMVSKALRERLRKRGARIVLVTSGPEIMKDKLLGKKECRPVYKTTLSPEDLKMDEKALEFDLRLRDEDIEITDPETLF